MRRWSVVSVGLIGVLLGGAAGAWAGLTVLAPAEEVPQEADYALVEAVAGSVSSVVRLGGAASWETVPNGTNNAVGVVTGVVVEPGDSVDACDVLYRVDESPVVIAQGLVPAYRDLVQGATGTDVSQLQQMLNACGFEVVVDGDFGAGTTAAVKAWEESLGVEQDGVVSAGDVVFVPSTPTRVVLDEDLVTRGARLSGGELAVSTLNEWPLLEATMSSSQAEQVSQGDVATVSLGQGEYPAVVGSVAFDELAQVYMVTLEPQLSECGQLCADVAVEGLTQFTAQVELVASTDGIVVPVAALVTGADGSPAVVDDAGDVLAVSVVVQAQGQAVVEGVDAGVKVRVPGE